MSKPQYILTEDSAYRTWETRENPVNYYGRLLSLQEDGRYIPVICMHGGSMWLCAGCAQMILQSEAVHKEGADPASGDTLAREREVLVGALNDARPSPNWAWGVLNTWDALVEIAKAARAVSDEYERSGEITDSSTEDGAMMEALAAALVALGGEA